MAWTTPRTWTTGEVVSASIMNTHVRDNFDQTAPAKATAAGEVFVATAANTIAARTPSQNVVNTSETTASTSYTDLATSGPAVTETTAAAALVWWSGHVSNNTGGQRNFMSVAVSGASTVSASDNQSLIFESDSAGQEACFGTYFRFSGLTSGSNVFTAKYRVDGGTGTFQRRRVLVFPL